MKESLALDGSEQTRLGSKQVTVFSSLIRRACSGEPLKKLSRMYQLEEQASTNLLNTTLKGRENNDIIESLLEMWVR